MLMGSASARKMGIRRKAGVVRRGRKCRRRKSTHIEMSKSEEKAKSSDPTREFIIVSCSVSFLNIVTEKALSNIIVPLKIGDGVVLICVNTQISLAAVRTKPWSLLGQAGVLRAEKPLLSAT